MFDINLQEARDLLFKEIPDGTTVAWPDLVTKAGKYRPIIDSLAFGKPESISRRGHNFVAKGSVSAQLKRDKFTVFADKAVRFSVNPTGNVVVSNISGITVQVVGLVTITITDVTPTKDAAGNFLIRTPVGPRFLGGEVTVIIKPNGENSWRFGR